MTVCPPIKRWEGVIVDNRICCTGYNSPYSGTFLLINVIVLEFVNVSFDIIDCLLFGT